MSEEYTTKTWIIEHDWKCGHCRTFNKGREDKCVACGKPIDDTHEEIIPWDMSYDNRVQDTKVFEEKNPDWICKYCSHRNRASKGKCEECGSDQSEKKQTVSSGQEITPGSKLPAPKRDDKGRPEYFEEYSHTSSTPQLIVNPDYDGPRSKPASKRPKPTPPPSGKPSHYRAPTFTESDDEEVTKVTIESRLLLPVGGFVAVALVVYFFFWLFSWHSGTATIFSTSWNYEVSTLQRSIQNGHSWRDQEPAHSFNESCEREIRSYHDCDPYQCNPHQVSYDCRCRSVETCRPSTSCRTVCSSNGTRSSSCSERCRTTTSCSSSTSCDTCYRTAYDTCYHRCPDYDQMCTYQYPRWSPVNRAHLSGSDHTPVRPTLRAQSNLSCPSDPEQLYIANNGVVDCHQENVTYAVTLDAGERGTRNYTPTSLTEYNRYHVGATWNIEYNHAGDFRVIGPR